jgi:hypothetical protein
MNEHVSGGPQPQGFSALPHILSSHSRPDTPQQGSQRLLGSPAEGELSCAQIQVPQSDPA